MGYREVCNLTCCYVRSFIHAWLRYTTESGWINGSIYHLYIEKQGGQIRMNFHFLRDRRAITGQWRTEGGCCIRTIESRKKTEERKKKARAGDSDRERKRRKCIIYDKDTM